MGSPDCRNNRSLHYDLVFPEVVWSRGAGQLCPIAMDDEPEASVLELRWVAKGMMHGSPFDTREMVTVDCHCTNGPEVTDESRL